MILIIAPRYDSVTERTHSVAEEALLRMRILQVNATHLFIEQASLINIINALCEDVEIIAYYGHGDEFGRLLTQEREPWCQACAGALLNRIIYAHACRGMRYLSQNNDMLRITCALGYRTDLFQPSSASESFWDRFRDIHAFVPEQLALRTQNVIIKESFYDFCTTHLHDLNSEDAGLVELIAIQQARDDFEIVQFSHLLSS